jgi:hypothetical protein
MDSLATTQNYKSGQNKLLGQETEVNTISEWDKDLLQKFTSTKGGLSQRATCIS